MKTRPYTVLSCAVSIDGCLDDASDSRLILSGPEDLDEVDAIRAGVDAILVGAGTIRADNPRLLVRSASRQAERAARGVLPHPLRVTLTSSGDLSPDAAFFTGPGPVPLVCCPPAAEAALSARLGPVAEVAGVAGVAEVASAGHPPSLAHVLSTLHTERSVASLLIEGGSRILRDALAGDLADELRLAVAPFFVGSPSAPRFAPPAAYPHDAARPLRLVSARHLGSVAVLHYLLTDRPRPASLPPLPA